MIWTIGQGLRGISRFRNGKTRAAPNGGRMSCHSPDDLSPAVFLSRRSGAAIERNSLSQAMRRLVTRLDAQRGR
jgi:hypothetical protein